MPVPEVTHSSPAADSVANAAQPVHNHDVQQVVERAQDQLRQLRMQRQEIAQRITIIKRTINGLALLGGGAVQSRTEETTTRRKRGITSACRVVLNRTDRSLTADEIYTILQQEFPDLFLQTRNHYAWILTTLNRLVTHGEARTFLRNRSRFWQRHQRVESSPPGLPDT